MSLRSALLGLIVLATVGFVIARTLERNSGESRRESAATLSSEGKTPGSSSESAGTHAAETGAGTTAHAAAPGGESHSTRAAETGTTAAPATESGGESTAAHAGETGTTTAPATTSGESTPSPAGGTGSTANSSTKPGTQTSAPAPTTSAIAQHTELKPLGVNVEAVPFVALAAVMSLVLALAAWFRPRLLLLLVGTAAAMLVFALLDIREVTHQSDEARTGLAVLAGVIAALHATSAGVAGTMARRAAHPART